MLQHKLWSIITSVVIWEGGKNCETEELIFLNKSLPITDYRRNRFGHSRIRIVENKHKAVQCDSSSKKSSCIGEKGEKMLEKH